MIGYIFIHTFTFVLKEQKQILIDMLLLPTGAVVASARYYYPEHNHSG